VLGIAEALRGGEVVVNLGSGGGLDVLLAARKVGPTGKAIGIDMTQEMIDLARRNAAKSGLGNIEFHLATIDKLPLPDASVDCVISNCVINLAPDKPAVFRDIARVLKPGGRLAVSDIALKRELPPEIETDLMAYVGCIAGAVLIEDYRRMLMNAGFAHVEVIDSGRDLNAYAKVENQAGCCSPSASSLPIAEVGCCSTSGESFDPMGANFHDRLAELLRRYDVNDYAASVRVFAVKP
jgi:SAM-dependent methyltransferase